MPLVNFIILSVNDVIGETGSNLRERNEMNKDQKKGRDAKENVRKEKQRERRAVRGR